MSWWEWTLLWCASLVAAAFGTGMRVAALLYGKRAIEPPEEPALMVHWQRRRRWIVISELSALPTFASLSVASVAYWGMNPVAAIIMAMVLAIAGFLLLLDGIQALVRLRLRALGCVNDEPKSKDEANG